MAKRKAPTVAQGRRANGGRRSRAGAGSGRKTSRRSGLSLSALRDSMLDQARDHRRELTGILLTLLGILTLVTLLLPAQGWLGSAWARLLRQGFGWGVYVVPLIAAAFGVWLVVSKYSGWLPRLEPEQILGGVLLYLAILVLFHALAGGAEPGIASDVARAGGGGGAVGAAILGGMIGSLGNGGTVVVLGAWILVALAFSLGFSPTDAAAALARRASRSGTASTIRSGDRRRGIRLAPKPDAPSSSVRLSDRRGSVRLAPDLEEAAPAIIPPPAASSGERSAPKPPPPAAGAERPEATAVEAPPAPRRSWALPEMESILEHGAEAKADEEFDRQRARMIEDTLLAFGAPARIVEINRGPAITQFGVEPDFVESRGGRRTKVKVSKISALADDLALALAAPSIRIEAPVPGKGYVGVEVPNTEISLVALRDVMDSQGFRKLGTRLRLGLGQDVSGRAIAADLASMPHLLIAGTTGSGKSVCVNAIVACLLLQNTPDDLRFVMVDPKRVELTLYNGIPHLLAPVVVELDRVVGALQWVSREMDERYRKFSRDGVRNIDEYNRRMDAAGMARLPFLVVVIDELADLMMLAPDETERVITRLAQLARATGIHLVIATQRPSVDVVTGLIKANFPARIAFAVASSIDSRVILDQPGAERLLGRGDMLFQSPEAANPIRMQGAFVSEGELARLISYWQQAALEAGGAPPLVPAESIPSGVPLKQGALWDEMAAEDEDTDTLFDEAVEIVRRMRRASISLLQRRLRIGYTRAARLVDQLEERGIIGQAQSGSQAREVLDYGELPAREEDQELPRRGRV
ncbi:MAG TPA: DNA translocase FtsK 4TM domain-containing protein [Anaerolineales bacterium]|nr:DNA translocase FtsK 4TM domain-containing protein [Anaerolineales bacterium]